MRPPKKTWIKYAGREKFTVRPPKAGGPQMDRNYHARVKFLKPREDEEDYPSIIEVIFWIILALILLFQFWKGS